MEVSATTASTCTSQSDQGFFQNEVFTRTAASGKGKKEVLWCRWLACLFWFRFLKKKTSLIRGNELFLSLLHFFFFRFSWITIWWHKPNVQNRKKTVESEYVFRLRRPSKLGKVKPERSGNQSGRRCTSPQFSCASGAAQPAANSYFLNWRRGWVWHWWRCWIIETDRAIVWSPDTRVPEAPAPPSPPSVAVS